MVRQISIKFDEKKLAAVRQKLGTSARMLPRIVYWSINKTAVSVKTAIARGLAGEVKMKISDIKRGIKITRASFHRWQSDVNVFGRRVPLSRFAARQTKKGVTYQISKSVGAVFEKATSLRRQVLRQSGKVLTKNIDSRVKMILAKGAK